MGVRRRDKVNLFRQISDRVLKMEGPTLIKSTESLNLIGPSSWEELNLLVRHLTRPSLDPTLFNKGSLASLDEVQRMRFSKIVFH